MDQSKPALQPSVTLRPPTAADRDAFVAAALRSRDLHAGWVHPPTTAADFDAWLERNASDTQRTLLACAATPGDPGALGIAAVFTFSQIFRRGFQNAYLGFYAFAPFAGTGTTRAGLRAALDYAFGPLALHRVEANVQPENVRSCRLVTRVGFREEGYSPRYLFIDGAWRDHVRYALTAEDW